MFNEFLQNEKIYQFAKMRSRSPKAKKGSLVFLNNRITIEG